MWTLYNIYVFAFLTVIKVQDLVEVCDADQQEWLSYQHYLTTITSIDLQAFSTPCKAVLKQIFGCTRNSTVVF